MIRQAICPPEKLRLRGTASLRGKVTPPGDKSISHRALILSALAEGESQIHGLSTGQDVAHTAEALATLGEKIDLAEALGGSANSSRRSEPIQIYLGNSGTGMRLLSGVCAALPVEVELDGDESLRRRPMNRIVLPLREMGAQITGQKHLRTSYSRKRRPQMRYFRNRHPQKNQLQRNHLQRNHLRKYPQKNYFEITAPLRIKGSRLHGIEYTLPVPSAQVKSALLLAGLSATGETKITEKLPTRRHTEEMLVAFGADISFEDESAEFGGGGVGSAGELAGQRHVTVRAGKLTAVDMQVPADPSQAAFWVVAALILPDSEITVENVYLGPERDGFVEVLKRMGADLKITKSDIDTSASGFPLFDICARTSQLHPTSTTPTESPGLIDEIPVLAVAAAFANGTTRFNGVAELRAKESDRIASVSRMLETMGCQARSNADTLEIHGTGRLVPPNPDTTECTTIKAAGDHRIAMAGAVAGLAYEGDTNISGWESVATSYPEFLVHMEQLGAGDNILERDNP